MFKQAFMSFYSDHTTVIIISQRCCLLYVKNLLTDYHSSCKCMTCRLNCDLESFSYDCLFDQHNILKGMAVQNINNIHNKKNYMIV